MGGFELSGYSQEGWELAPVLNQGRKAGTGWPWPSCFRHECCCEGHRQGRHLHRSQSLFHPRGEFQVTIPEGCLHPGCPGDIWQNNEEGIDTKRLFWKFLGDVVSLCRVTRGWWMEGTIFVLPLGRVCPWCCSWWDSFQAIFLGKHVPDPPAPLHPILLIRESVFIYFELCWRRSRHLVPSDLIEYAKSLLMFVSHVYSFFKGRKSLQCRLILT